MANKVLQLIQESGAKWVDFRFTDTKGKEQHVTYPADTIDEDTFEDGKMFDGSSIAGWKGIEASDMILRPDAATGFIDPFFAEPTVVVTCDVIEPSTGQGYDRDPRSIARRAELLKMPLFEWCMSDKRPCITFLARMISPPNA